MTESLTPYTIYNDEDIYVQKNANGTETYIFDPYNPLNREITQTDVEQILAKYGINLPITKFELYKRAFIHRSYLRKPDAEYQQNNIVVAPKPDNCLPLHTKCNERLEFVGDGVLECVTKYYLYCRFPKENEGFMTEKKIALVKNEAIGKLALEMGLHKWYIMSRHTESKQTRTNLKKLGCLFEAFLGAIFLDFNKMTGCEMESEMGLGFKMVRLFVEAVFEKHVDWDKLIRTDDNYKNILQVRLQKQFRVTPHYMEVTEHNPETGFHMGVYLCLGQPIFGLTHYHSVPVSNFKSFADIHQHMATNGRVFVFLGDGQHKIKKNAEQMACDQAISNLANF